MVIEKILKVNSTDPKVDELRKRLQALQQKPEAPANTTPGAAAASQPAPAASAPSAQPAPKDDIKKLQELSFQEQKQLMERSNPELRLKEERTNHLIMNQIKELITLNNEATKRIKELETKQADLLKQLEGFKEKHEETMQKMNSIDSRLEKFMGLYEIITNQYNPFADNQMPRAPARTAAPIPPPSNPTAPKPAPQPVAPSAPAATFHVEDNLTRQSATVEVKQEDMQAAEAQFKRVEELLAGLRKEQEAAPTPLANAQPPPQATGELHALLAGFEQRLSKQFDESLQQKLHQGFSALEQNLQAELRDALRAEIEKAQHDDDEVQQALEELQALMAGTNKEPVEEELATLTKELEQVRKEFQQLPSHLHFRLADGRVLAGIGDLQAALPSMPPELFAKHVSGERNDFASWVEHALQQPELAAKMRQAKSAQELAALIAQH